MTDDREDVENAVSARRPLHKRARGYRLTHLPGSVIAESLDIEDWRTEHQQDLMHDIVNHAQVGDLPATDVPKEIGMTRHGVNTDLVGSQKQRILALYREQSENRVAQGTGKPAKRKGFVGLTVIDTAKSLEIPPHDVTHALYDLRKQGLVEFREAKSTGRARAAGSGSKGSSGIGGTPVRIRITKKGVEMATPTDMEFEDEKVPSEPDAPGLDVSSLETPDHQRNLQYDPTAPDTLMSHLPQDLEDKVEDITQHAAEAAAKYMTDPRVAGSDVVDAILTDLPLINGLRTRADKVQQAEDLLREAGLDEAADLVQGEKEVRTGLEREVLTLLDRLNFR